ncbi:hypothetical protein F53441_7079 [Fusarium austroafricanum]|uniref:Uncharacterized protein n=1 Tax=Fusarium austroafricanum TaxID=2364996 RepID=A0A8H4KI95_9HYPO|nr:hypothetical protein F53441_7079 [Fusarium austroafricanum]
MADASPNPQLQSTFITRLPREVRDGIYLELWRLCGLRQHIIWHENKDDKPKSHFCHWKCTTPFDVEDKLQEEIDATRIELGVPLGVSFTSRTNALRLFSAWRNHWPCGERIAEVYGDEMDPGISTSTSRGPCWSQLSENSDSETAPKWSPYISMLLSCKLISSECLKSIYESTTFIFTDTFALNAFGGFCKQPFGYPAWPKVPVPPPSFRSYTRHIELSLSPVFSTSLQCVSPIFTPEHGERHSSRDFHGLCLGLVENLTTVDIWIAARSTTLLLNDEAENIDQQPYNITNSSVEQLREALLQIQASGDVTISTPLAQCTEPEDGYIVQLDGNPSIWIWRRGAGDRYHPSTNPIIDKKMLNSNVWSSEERKVKLAYNPQTIEHVHYAMDIDWSVTSPPESSQPRGRVARFVEKIRSKGKWFGKDR